MSDLGDVGKALRRLSVAGPYVVYYYSDECDRGCYWTFAGALERVCEGLARGVPAVSYRIINFDRADGGYGDDGGGSVDGLTDDEREALDEALSR